MRDLWYCCSRRLGVLSCWSVIVLCTLFFFFKGHLKMYIKLYLGEWRILPFCSAIPTEARKQNYGDASVFIILWTFLILSPRRILIFFLYWWLWNGCNRVVLWAYCAGLLVFQTQAQRVVLWWAYGFSTAPWRGRERRPLNASEHQTHGPAQSGDSAPFKTEHTQDDESTGERNDPKRPGKK